MTAAIDTRDDGPAVCIGDLSDGGIMWARPMLENLSPFLNCMKGKRILILGAGNNALGVYLSKYGGSIYSIDKKRSPLWKANDHAYCCVASSEALPFEDRAFDMVLSCSTFQYVRHQIVFDEIHRVCKNDALVFLHENLPKNPIIAIYRMRGKIYSLFDRSLREYLSGITAYLNPGALPREGYELELIKAFYLVSTLNHLLLRRGCGKFSVRLAEILAAIDRFILKNTRILDRYCWFCVYRLRIKK